MVNNIPETEKIADQLANIPHGPGIYKYRDISGQIIYVGKALDLYKRVHQYFQAENLLSPKTRLLVAQINDIETIRTASEFDALLLEAKLINGYQPKYNILAKDDKSPIYILLTLSEKLPRITLLRKRQIAGIGVKKSDSIFGPFQSSRMTREILRLIRMIIPFCTEKIRNGKPCFYTQIKLCDPCPSYITGLTDPDQIAALTRQYRQNIFRIKRLLSGRTDIVKNDLEKEMNLAAQQLQYEKAAIIRNKISALNGLLQKHFDPMLYTSKSTSFFGILSDELGQLKKILSVYYPDLPDIQKIECYDISNLVGKSATGSMVVSVGGMFETGLYRKFKIRIPVINDFAMIEEMLTRRLKHPEWPYPELLVIDGGKGQVNAAYEVVRKMNLRIPVIGLAKRREEIVLPTEISEKVIRLSLDNPSLQMLERIRDEAHRFAVTFHRLLRSKTFISKKT
jgi:excinuclease ABC subunit C